MRPYEIVLILDGAAEEGLVDTIVTGIGEQLSSSNGKVGQVEKWGRRRFAYEMKHRWEGYYALVELNAEPASMATIDRMLSLSDDVVRHKIVRVPESVAGKPRATRPQEAAPAAASTGASE